jgi:hypothetical protein
MIKAPTSYQFEDPKRHNVRFVMRLYEYKVYHSVARGFFLQCWESEGCKTFGELVTHLDSEINETKEKMK